MTTTSAIAQSGIAAATLRLAVSASNLANANDASAPGVASAQAVTARTAQLLVYDPASPVAGVGGMVQTPEIDPIAEITNQIAAGRAFAFSLEALKTADEEQQSLLDIKA